MTVAIDEPSSLTAGGFFKRPRCAGLCLRREYLSANDDELKLNQSRTRPTDRHDSTREVMRNLGKWNRFKIISLTRKLGAVF